MTRQSAEGVMLYARPYLQPAFLICAAVLAIAGGGMSVAIKSFGVILKKEPIALKKPLELLDEKRLAPYKVVSRGNIESEEIIKSLGTEDYIQWVLEDADAPPDGSVRSCGLFITYYGVPDVVLHVPEECYMGSGNQRLASEKVLLEIDKSRTRTDVSRGSQRSLETQEISGRYVVFSGAKSGLWGEETKFAILYTFCVNGQYKGSREDARFALNKNIRGKHSYFSKIEWQFFGTKFGRRIYPGREEAITASEKLLGVILAVLEEEHWPKWDE